AVGDLLHLGELSDHPDLEFLRKHKPLSLGQWLAALRAAAKALAGQPDRLIDELPAAGAADGEVVRGLDGLVACRNRTFSPEDGSIVISEDECPLALPA